MRRFAVTLASFAAMSVAANAADIPVKAPVAPVAAVYNWSGIYGGGVFGFQHARVHDLAPASGFVTDSKVITGIWGGVVGAQYQFGSAPWGAWVIGVEAAFNAETYKNSPGN